MKLDDFISIDDFQSYVRRLSPEEIQHWSTNEWLEVYEKIDKLRTSQKNNISYDEFVNKVCIDEFSKLYRNYKFDAEELQTVRKMAEITGENLALQGKIDLAQLLINKEQIYPQMSNVIDAVQEISQMPHAVKFETHNSGMFDTTKGSANYFSISLSKNKLEDRTLITTAHESAHSLLQRDCSVFKEDYTKKELSHSEAFSRLLEYNHHYYLIGTESLECFKGYKHQPIEKHANFFGYFCDRRFRKKAQQPTERCAMNLLKILGNPLHAHYENKAIVMEYPLDRQQKIKALSAITPPEFFQSEQKDDVMCLKIRHNFKFNRFLDKMRNHKLEINQDISFQQYLDYPALSDYMPESKPIPDVKLPKITDFSKHPRIFLTQADCDNCEKLILPRQKPVDDFRWSQISYTMLPAKVDCDKGNALFYNCDFSKVQEITAHKSIIAIKKSRVPDNFDFSKINSAKFEYVDLSNLKDVKWPHKIISLKGCKLPENLDLSKVKSVNLCGADLAKTQNIKLPENLDNVVIPKEMLAKYPALKTAVTVTKELKKMKDLYAKTAKNKPVCQQYMPNLAKTHQR